VKEFSSGAYAYIIWRRAPNPLGQEQIDSECGQSRKTKRKKLKDVMNG
jgi:hypothetical protein